MFRKLIPVSGVLLLLAGVAGAQSLDESDRKDLQVLKDIAQAVDRYTQFTIFDDVNASVKDGSVTLTGKVTMPYKRDDIEKRVVKVDGVHGSRQSNHRAAGVEVRRRAAVSDRAVDLQQLELLELRDHAESADPHRRGARPCDADRRRAEQRGSRAGAIAGHAVRRVVGDQRLKTDAEIAGDP